MTEPKFTKGPWRVTTVDDFGDFTIAEPDKPFAIATTANGDTRAYLGDKEQTRANAHLIAAAPELESALRNLLSFTLFLLEDPSRGEDVKAIREARAALAKARGEQ